ncbi:MAG: dihydropteroate synthase [Planctomycetes bacterium]|nr:dihydropteroate synthase [Planctomycetota bacterium]
MPSPTWTFRTASLTLDQARIIAIINLTPDSFYDGGSAGDSASDSGPALHAAARAVADGAHILDLGAESTRPGASSVDESTQLARLLPVIRAIRASRDTALSNIPISIDTTRAAVARAAIDAGADIINDVSAGTDDAQMLSVMAASQPGVILMHRLVKPAQDRFSDQYAQPPQYQDVVAEVGDYLRQRVRAALDAGVRADSILIDPGLGFGKSVEDNLALIRGTSRLLDIARQAAPVAGLLSALSRKSFVGRVSLGRDSQPSERLPGTLALSLQHLSRGARIFRVHDVKAHVAILQPAGLE